jgi:hypothetical protein
VNDKVEEFIVKRNSHSLALHTCQLIKTAVEQENWNTAKQLIDKVKESGASCRMTC